MNGDSSDSNRCKKVKFAGQNGTEAQPTRPNGRIASRKADKASEASYKAKFEEVKRGKTNKLMADVRSELIEIQRRLEERAKASSTTVEEVQKIHLAAQQIEPNADFNKFYHLVYEHEIIAKASSDLKLIIIDLALLVQQLDKTLKVAANAPAMVLANMIIEKHRLIQSINVLKEGQKARALLQSKMPESALAEINRHNFDTSKQEARLAALRKEIEDYNF